MTTAALASRVEQPSSGPSARPHYRPHLDGLRAVAVYLVVAFHSGIGRLEGGFIGVDVFFVLSGYLVTKLLLRDVVARGRIGFPRFYSRRFRRLLPAAVATLLITSAVYTAVASPAESVDALRGVRAAFLYVANWFFIRQSQDYFAADITSNPVVHFWSLSIEEQFYFVWPLLLTGLFFVTRRAGSRQWLVLRSAVALGLAASLFRAVQLSHTDLSRAYYGTDTRAYQLLAGALLALTPQLFTEGRRLRAASRIVAPVALVALLMTATSFVSVQPINRGVLAVVATCALIIAIENANASVSTRLLSLPPFVYLGRVSYGTYLWHWPVIVVATIVLGEIPKGMFWIAALLGTGLAALSFEILERPVRESRFLDRYRVPVIGIGLAVSVFCAAVIAPAIFDDRKTGDVAAATTATGMSPVPADLNWKAAQKDRPDFPSCVGEAVTNCILVRGSGPHVMLMGDSHARMFVPTFEKIAQEHDLTLSVAIWPVCPWQEEIFFDTKTEDCRQHKSDWYKREIPTLDPDVVVVTHRAWDDPAAPEAVIGPAGTVAYKAAEYEQTLLYATVASMESLRSDGRKLVIIEPTPVPRMGFDPLSCLSSAKFLEDCRYVANEAPPPLERAERNYAQQHDDIWALDFDKLVCPYLPICDAYVDGNIVKRDKIHITGTYARQLSDEVWTTLHDNNVL